MKRQPETNPSGGRGSGSERSRKWRRFTSGILSAAMLAASFFGTTGWSAEPAYAAAGAAFPSDESFVFVAQGSPTRLYKAVNNGLGAVVFQPEGPAAGGNYNAIAYNDADDYLYGISNSGSLLRIGQGGGNTHIGPTGLGAVNVGVFDNTGKYWVANSSGSALYQVNLANGNVVTTRTLTAQLLAPDLALAHGYFWGMGGGEIVRVNPVNGAVVRWANPASNPATSAGASWTYGNGNLGFSENATGRVTQLAVTNPTAANPTFTVVSTTSGPSSGLNDGAASQGEPTDLLMQKSGPEVVLPGDHVEYTLTVTNNGPGVSSGHTVTDTFPSAMLNVASSNPACDISGSTATCTGGRLEAGQSATYIITADAPSDLTESVTNSASVLANEEDPDPSNNSDSSTGTPSSVTLVKVAGTPVDVNNDGLVNAGDRIPYTFEVTNTGAGSVTGITISDPKLGAVMCPAGDIAPGESLTCVASPAYVVTSDDEAVGAVNNTATASATPVGGSDPVTSDESSTTTPLVAQAPSLTVNKTATPAVVGKVGDTVTYNFEVVNTGNVALHDVTVVDDNFGGSGTLSAIDCPSTDLAVGESIDCIATYGVTQADVDAGSFANSATAEGTAPGADDPTPSVPSETTVNADADPALELVKSATPATVAAAGETVTYNFEVTNTGNVTMHDIAVVDDNFEGSGTLSAIACPATELAPDASMSCSATYEVTQVDVDNGNFTNSATVEGTPPAGGTPVPSDPSETTVTVDGNPSMSLVKSATPATVAAPGETVTYTFVVTNTGNVTMHDVTVVDDNFEGSGDLSAIACSATELAPGESFDCAATYEVTQADIDNGDFSNSATVEGTPPGGGTPVPSDPSNTTVEVDENPVLSLVKSATPATVAAAGETVTYNFVVTNTGNVTMHDVAVVDDDFEGTNALSPIDCPATELAPGESFDCSATYVVSQEDVNNGGFANSATVGGTPPGGGTPVPSEPSETTVTAEADPSMTVVKTANPADVAVAGETVTYNFEVTNTGNVTMHDVAIVDDNFEGSGELSAIECPVTTLAVGGTINCTATYEVTQADVDNGGFANSATVEGTPPGSETPVPSEPSETTVTIDPEPSLEIVKSSDLNDPADFVVGHEIVYSFVVTNIGNVSLDGVTVNDDNFTGTGELSDVVCPAEVDALAPGEQGICTATYEVTQADVDAGEITNTATAEGTPPGSDTPVPSDPSTITVPGDQNPALTVVKSSDMTDSADFVVGAEVTYSFLVTNTGNTTMSDVTVSDEDFTGTGELSAIVCPVEGEILTPGEVSTCTATYTVTQADVDAGSVSNTATAEGTPPGSDTPVPSVPSTVTVPGDQNPSLVMVKSADTETITRAGETITYSFLVTNTGNVTLDDIDIVESDFTGTGELSEVACPAELDMLAPGEQGTCTATYEVTQADLAAGELSNTATATAPGPDGEPVTSEPSTVSVDISVPAQPAPTKLAWTGSNPTQALAVAALLLTLGLSAMQLAAARRRRVHAATISSVDAE